MEAAVAVEAGGEMGRPKQLTSPLAATMVTAPAVAAKNFVLANSAVVCFEVALWMRQYDKL
jgi:hypothetical protein